MYPNATLEALEHARQDLDEARLRYANSSWRMGLEFRRLIAALEAQVRALTNKLEAARDG